MLILALDSSATASVALARVDQAATSIDILAQKSTEDTRSHAEVMAPFVRDVLDQAKVDPSTLDALVCGTGPGPFTGLRAGIMTARTLGFAWGKPVLGLISLSALAELVYSEADLAPGTRFAVATDARRREVYSAEYATTAEGYELLSGPQVGAASELKELPIFGLGAALYPDDLDAQTQFSTAQPDATYLLKAAVRRGIENLSQDTSALYLRESDAKVPQVRKKATPVPSERSRAHQKGTVDVAG